ncbi:MAG: hypothetical protein CFE21_08465 [Bacteroidetes bacterium B1(2017)]|nr:MAG: hypothetical protein CFE21_08465 [Bacteroidetes bacterium B1(2017)]
MLSVTKQFRFEAAHAILNYDGLCKNIHGHSYILHVTIGGKKDPETQMVIDFKLVKKWVDETFLTHVDHALILNHNNPEISALESYVGKKYFINGEPTAENLLETIAELLLPKLPSNTKLLKLKLYETESSYAEWTPDIA